jgi:hypothetical protein
MAQDEYDQENAEGCGQHFASVLNVASGADAAPHFASWRHDKADDWSKVTQKWLTRVWLIESRRIAEIAAHLHPTITAPDAGRRLANIYQLLVNSCTNSSYIISLPKGDYGVR